MTDNIPEKIEPCVICRKAPNRSPNGYCICSSENECLMWDYLLALEPEGWNELMTGLLARRRADFEAGWQAFDEGEHGHVDVECAAYLSRPKGDA